jgi:hypothetical protein
MCAAFRYIAVKPSLNGRISELFVEDDNGLDQVRSSFVEDDNGLDQVRSSDD